MTAVPAKRRSDPPINATTAALFLEEYGWLAKSRHPRDRLAYRLVEFLMDQVAQARIAAGAVDDKGKWEKKIAKGK